MGQERARKAYEAMSALGIPSAKVKPVLKNLWRLHNKDWTVIEEGNYRVLVDTIFEEEDAKARAEEERCNNYDELNEESGSLPHVEPEPEPPLKRLRSDYASSSREQLVDNVEEETLLSPLPLAMILPVEYNEPCSMDIASSPLGEVKLSLSCTTPIGRQGLPDIDAVLKLTEDKCLRKVKIIDPNFSLKNLFGQLCECYLELARTQDGSDK